MQKLIEKQLIKGETIGDLYFLSLENIDYHAVHYGFRNDRHSCECFNSEGIFLTEHITEKLYSGEELLYYPFLAKEIRKLDTYPYLKKQYAINKDKKGIEFLNFLAQYTNECLQAFKAERLERYKNFNHLIHLHGYDRYLPLIENIEEKNDEQALYPAQILTINGLKWHVGDYRKSALTESINMRKLLKVSSNYRYVTVNQILKGTPFLALKCCMHEYNKGRVFWYDLSTGNKTTQAEALAWEKPR